MTNAKNDMQRAAHLRQLQNNRFDILVIGGGATGAGVALDAASRGLSVALVERDDFASGTSSRSTKLVHGGVRYLEAAITQLDRAQYHLVREALVERAILLNIAPHLVHPLRTVVPAYSWRDVITYRAGLWLYDRAARGAAIQRSRFLSRDAMLRSFPHLKRKRLKGGVAYYDGQFDDARMAITLLKTAVRQSATVANYVEATTLTERGNALTGAIVKNRLTDDSFPIRARAVINATGPESDAICQLEDPQAQPQIAPSRGTHVALDASWTPAADGLLVPKTSDGRVLFLLPWHGVTIAGTTDVPAKPHAQPIPTNDEIDYLLRQLGEWLDPAPTRTAIRASWAGLRPLIAGHTTNTARVVREHQIKTGPKGLITIAGGKWTTYRLMAEETVDRAIANTDLKPTSACHTDTLRLIGAASDPSALAQTLAQRHDIAPDIAQHLAEAYGSEATDIVTIANGHYNRRLLDGYPYIEAEVLHSRDHEMALTAEDIIARRLRLAFLDQTGASSAKQHVERLLHPPSGTAFGMVK